MEIDINKKYTHLKTNIILEWDELFMSFSYYDSLGYLRHITKEELSSRINEFKEFNLDENIPTDFFGKPLYIGDEVAFMQLGYRNFIKGKISKLTPQKATIEHERQNVGGPKTVQFFYQLIKIN